MGDPSIRVARAYACSSKKGKEQVVEDIFKKWDLACSVIGEVIAEDRLLFHYHGELVADVPASTLVLGGGAPVYDREYREPAYIKEYAKFNINSVSEPEDLKAVAVELIKNPNIASKRWIYEQYDSMVGTKNMSTNLPSDAAVVNIKKTNRALVVTTDCNSRYVKANPRVGATIAVAEAARNIVCSGGEPCAITNCLNFGNPYNPEVYWQFVQTIKGMSDACIKFDTPVTGGNVSFYNQSDIGGKVEAVHPTPVIGMLGVLEDKKRQMTLAFRNKGDVIYLIGRSQNDISSSEYLYSIRGVKESPAPYFNLDEEYAVQQTVAALIKNGYINSAHDVSDGGLFITLLESAMVSNSGFDITSDAEIRPDAFLFGEAQGRVVVSVSPGREVAFTDFMNKQHVSATMLGHVTKSEVRIDDVSYGFVSDLKALYDNSLGNIIEQSGK